MVTNTMSSKPHQHRVVPTAHPAKEHPRCCPGAARPGPSSHPETTALMTISQHHTHLSPRTRKLGIPQTQKLSGGS